MLPQQHLQIAPEALEIANCYLQYQDIQKTCELLNLPLDVVTSYLDRREVRSYIDHVFANVGFNNQFKMQALMDDIIKKKLEDMQEAQVGSSKDITDILALKHKMSMDILDRQIKLEQVRQNRPTNQVNVQINGSNSRYDQLIEKLIN